MEKNRARPSGRARNVSAFVAAPVARERGSRVDLVHLIKAFVLGIVGTFIGRRKLEDPAKQAEMEVRSLTGVGVEKAVAH